MCRSISCVFLISDSIFSYPLQNFAENPKFQEIRVFLRVSKLFWYTHTPCKVCWFVCRYILNWSSTLILRKKKPVCLFWSFFQWEEKCLSPDAPRHLVYQISLSSYRRDWPTVFVLCPAFDSVSIFIFFRDSSFHPLSQPLTNPIDLFFLPISNGYSIHTLTRDVIELSFFFSFFGCIISHFCNYIFIYIYNVFKRGR